MKKSELLKLLENLVDDDQVFIEVDGGEYWGSYLEVPNVEIHKKNWETVGHPGGKTKELVSNYYAVLKK